MSVNMRIEGNVEFTFNGGGSVSFIFRGTNGEYGGYWSPTYIRFPEALAPWRKQICQKAYEAYMDAVKGS